MNLPKKSTLRLISNHQKVNLFEKFDNVDYSFGVNFEFLKDEFIKFQPKIISQKQLFKNFLNKDIYSVNNDKISKTIELLSGFDFENMGDQFFNFSFYSK